MPPDAQREPHVVAEGPDVRAGIALHPEEDEAPVNTEDFELLDLTDAEVPLDRALPGRALVQPAGELPCKVPDPIPVHVAMKTHQADVLLLVLEEERGEPHGVAEHDE